MAVTRKQNIGGNLETRAEHNLQRSALGDPLIPVKSDLLKVPPPPKIVSSAGEQTF